MPTTHFSRSQSEAQTAGPAHLLEPTPLLDPNLGKVVLSLYGTAGEASIVLRHGRGRAPGNVPINEQVRRDRANQEHDRRARSKVRRYCRHNRSRFLWTLTYAQPCRTMDQAGADIDDFLRGVREEFGRIPLVAVCEPHPGGHGYHWHFAASSFLPIKKIRKIWGHGHVHVGDPGKLRAKVSPRKLAGYLAKYVGKSLDDDDAGATVEPRRRGQHRYRLTQGFSPERTVMYFATRADAYTWLHLNYGQHDQYALFSVIGDGPDDGSWFSFPDRCFKRIAPPGTAPAGP